MFRSGNHSVAAHRLPRVQLLHTQDSAFSARNITKKKPHLYSANLVPPSNLDDEGGTTRQEEIEQLIRQTRVGWRQLEEDDVKKPTPPPRRKLKSTAEPKQEVKDEDSARRKEVKSEFDEDEGVSKKNWYDEIDEEYEVDDGRPSRHAASKRSIISDKEAASALSFLTEDPDEPLLEDPDTVEYDEFLVNEVLEIGRHMKITAAGRIMTFSALVLLGTGEATAGLGRGRGESVQKAVEKATITARRNLISIQRHRNCTISSDMLLKYKRTKVVMKACRTGYGVKASYDMRIVLEAFGLTDLSMTTLGRKTNKQALYRALFKGLQTQIRTPEELAKNLGRKLFDSHRTFYYKTD